MSLSRQLLIILAGLFLFVFAGIFWISVNNTRQYLAMQLASHAQDTATSLGLSLAPHLRHQDMAAMHAMINAIFDRGYYLEIVLENLQGQPLIERANPMRIEGIPPWFIRLLPLDTPWQDSLITTGWHQAGRIKVQSNPGYAYDELWRSAVQTCLWSVAAFALCMLLVLALLRLILSPLRSVEAQALAICKREFPVVEAIPRTRELKRVVLAMNKMSATLEHLISRLVSYAERMRREAHADTLTGLNNRRAFDTYLGHVLRSAEKIPMGVLALLRVNDFAAYNRRHGYQEGDQLLKDIARLIDARCSDYAAAWTARIGGADFAVILPNAGRETAESFAVTLSHGLADLAAAEAAHDLAHIGLACFVSGDRAGDVLAAADAALGQAQAKGANAWYLLDTGQAHAFASFGAQQWRQVIERALRSKSLALLRQPVRACADGSLLHEECFVRMPGEDGELIAAGAFIPMAERLGLVGDLDRQVLEYALSYLETEAGRERRIAVNLSPQSLHDGTFCAWLGKRLAIHKAAAARLTLEVSEYGATQNVAATKRFMDALQSLGVHIGIDHFGLSFAAFGCLRQLKPDYIKVDGSLVRGIADDKDNRFFLATLAKIAHGLDIKVIGECVESIGDWQTLIELHADGGQGYYLGGLEDLA